jgi:hypothetical protein
LDFLNRTKTRSESAASGEGVIDNEHDDRANDCDQKTPGIKAGYAHAACCIENEASNCVASGTDRRRPALWARW